MKANGHLRAGDRELVEATRRGDSAAYAELWRRHAHAAASAARHFTSIAEADDLVAEAYTRILDAIRRGSGPTGAFRPYLYSTVRNLARAWSHHEDAVQIEDFDAFVDQKGIDNPTESAIERGITVAAFRSLPERWQTVLWYTEVEQLDPHEVAPLLGTNANGAAALAYRAREGLRRAWLQAHVNDRNTPPECRWTVQRLGRYARDGLGAQESARVEEHLLGCTRCTVIAAEVHDIASRLAVVVAPLFLGSVGLTALLAGLRDSSSASAAALPAIAGAHGSLASTGAGTGAGAASTAGLSGGWIAGGSIVGGIVAAAAVAAVVVGATIAPTSAVPEAAMSPAPSTSSSASPEPPIESPAPSPSSPPVAAPLPTEPPAESAPVVHTPVPTPTPTPTPTNPPADPPTDPPADPPADVEALPPVVTTTIDPTATTRPDLAGTAEPGATITVADGDGDVLATTTADGTGAWSTPPLDELSPTATSLSIVQRDLAGNVSPATVIGPFAFTPRFIAPTAPVTCTTGETVTFTVSGWANVPLVVSVIGAAWAGSTTIDDPSGTAVFTGLCLLPGDYTLQLTYQGGTAADTISGTVS